MSFGYNVSYKVLDRGLIEVIGPLGITKTVKQLSKQVSFLQTGYIYNYAFIMLVGVTFLLLFIMLWNIFLIIIDLRLFAIFVFIILFLFN